ncbi:MAG: hypothetical protein KatS3mg096_903 [Candidatus Parcubacteria bacterium]|nr:MAG: hypothetical protein KatS3mg096_903 [Candidatus Parcubacteria bacterium]
MRPERFDKIIKKFLKFLNLALWTFLVIILILWYSNNKEKFFPKREIKQIPNPINPFK